MEMLAPCRSCLANLPVASLPLSGVDVHNAQPPPRDRCTSTSQQHQTRHHNTISRGPLAVYDGGGKRKKDADHEHTDDGSSTSTSAEEQEDERSLKSRAWNSGSLLVRAGSEAPSGRVPRKTYIYLVGNARAEDRIEVEVIVGAEKNRTVLSKSSGVTCASVPARDVYTVRNLSGDGKTAVLFWTSPSGDDEVGIYKTMCRFSLCVLPLLSDDINVE